MIQEFIDCTVPERLNGEFLMQALRHSFKRNDITIHKIIFSAGASGGDNYLSKIYRVIVSYTLKGLEPKNVNLIVKYEPEIEDERRFVHQRNASIKEHQMYLQVLPKLEKLLGGKVLMPQCFYTISEPNVVFVLEDLKASGFQLANRITGLDEQHCKVVLKKLGEFHAASMILLQKDPLIKQIQLLHRQTLFTSSTLKGERMQKFLRRNIDLFLEHMTDLRGMEDIIMRLQKLDTVKLLEQILQLTHSNDDGITILNHGDLWVNNLLFSYDDVSNTPHDVAFIDFQGSMLASPGLDLNYFFVTSPMTHVLLEKDRLIEDVYYAALRSTLEASDFDQIPSLTDIRNEMRKWEIYGIMCLFAVLPILSMSKDDSVDMSLERIRSGKITPGMFATKRFLDAVKCTIKTYDDCGLLD